MRRSFWIVPLLIVVAVASYFVGRPESAPADSNDPAAAKAQNAPRGTKPGPMAVFGASTKKVLANAASRTEAAPAQLPIRQIVLYSSGVGYFKREGEVEGDAQVKLSFPVQDINDLLKSMVLQDLDGGHVSAVSYDSHDPLEKTLNSFAIHLANNPSHAQLLNQARGERVEIALSEKRSGDQRSVHVMSPAIQGTILGVETRPSSGKDSPSAEVLNLWCQDGMRGIPLADVQRVKFLDPAVESEFNRALDVLARGHDSQQKSVVLQFDGCGKRTVRVGYVVEAPLWRASYRLLVGKDGKLFVQGWALVENPTNEDWKDVNMALVFGRPISFKMELYQPLYAPRPVVQSSFITSVQPTAHNASLVGNPLQESNVNTKGIVGGAYEGQMGYEYHPAPDFSDSYKYSTKGHVTIARQKSALLPIINQELEGEKVSLYSPYVHAKYPLLALRLKNTTGIHLTPGPVAVFEVNGYGGDTQIPDLQPGEERLVSYALDLGIEVESEASTASRQLASIRLQKGILSWDYRVSEVRTYAVKNRSPHDRTVLVEHPYNANYKLISKDLLKELAKDVYRFELKVKAGNTASLEVVEEWHDRSSLMTAFDVAKTKYFLLFEFGDASAKAALERLLAMQEKLTAIRQDLAGPQKQLADITRDQERLRANLKEMPADSAAYKRYLEKFDSQESIIEDLQTQIKVLQPLEQKHQRDCEDYFKSLDFETTIREPDRK